MSDPAASIHTGITSDRFRICAIAAPGPGGFFDKRPRKPDDPTPGPGAVFPEIYGYKIISVKYRIAAVFPRAEIIMHSFCTR